MPCATRIVCLAFWAHLVAFAVVLCGCGGGDELGASPECQGVQSYGANRCFGTAPFCSGGAQDCHNNGLEFVTTDSDCEGNQHSCKTGNKAVCRPIESCCPGYGYRAGHPSSCEQCPDNHYSTGGLGACQPCEGCRHDQGQVRIGCGGESPGTCQDEYCVNMIASQICPAGANHPCVFQATQTRTHTTGSSDSTTMTVGARVTVTPSEMTSISDYLDTEFEGSVGASHTHTTYVEMRTSESHQSVIALMPGSSFCHFNRAHRQSDGHISCGQAQISSTILQSTGMQNPCPIDQEHPAYSDSMCGAVNVNICAGNQVLLRDMSSETWIGNSNVSTPYTI